VQKKPKSIVGRVRTASERQDKKSNEDLKGGTNTTTEEEKKRSVVLMFKAKLRPGKRGGGQNPSNHNDQEKRGMGVGRHRGKMAKPSPHNEQTKKQKKTKRPTYALRRGTKRKPNGRTKRNKRGGGSCNEPSVGKGKKGEEGTTRASKADRFRSQAGKLCDGGRGPGAAGNGGVGENAVIRGYQLLGGGGGGQKHAQETTGLQATAKTRRAKQTDNSAGVGRQWGGKYSVAHYSKRVTKDPRACDGRTLTGTECKYGR